MVTFSERVKNEIQNKYFTLKNRHSRITQYKSDSYDKSVLREIFLKTGTVSDPEKAYHLEFGIDTQEEAAKVLKALAGYGIVGGVVNRRQRYAVYLKGGESISAFLALIGAHNALLEFENARVLREMRESVQRRVNCETANISKTVSASLKQIDDIRYIDGTIGLNALPEILRETARVRLEFPDATLNELAERLDGTGRSGVNHRLRKISEIASGLRDSGSDLSVGINSGKNQLIPKER